MSNIHPYNRHSGAYNFFFHPLHSPKKIVRALSIITNIFATVISAGLWQIPFWVVNRRDQRKIDKWEGKPPKTSGVASQTFKTTPSKTQTHRPPGTDQTEIPMDMPTDDDDTGTLPTPPQDGHAPPSVSYSQEFLDLYPVYFQNKLSEERDDTFKPLTQFLQSFTFNPPIDYDNLTTFELLMTALLVAQGHFSRSDGVETSNDPAIQIKALTLLDSVVVNLNKREDLPLRLRAQIRRDYFRRIGNLIEHFCRSDPELPQLISELRDLKFGLNQPSASLFVKRIEDKFGSKVPENLTLRMKNPDFHPGVDRLSWVLATLPFESDFFGNITVKLLEEMVKLTPRKTLIREVGESGSDYLRKYMLEINSNKPGLKEEYETAFPGSIFELGKLSSEPYLFEIPLLASELEVKINCYLMSEDGNVSIKHFGPDTATNTINIAMTEFIPSGYILEP